MDSSDVHGLGSLSIGSLSICLACVVRGNLVIEFQLLTSLHSSIAMIFSRSSFLVASSCSITARRFSRMVRTPIMNITEPFEEETLPYYKSEQFYPIHIGQTLNDSFTVLGKLGYGAYSPLGSAET